jgi:hypothetical protein
MTPTKYEIERAFHRLMENGDVTAIANGMSHAPQYVSDMYSPDNERKSNLFRAIRDLRAWRKHNTQRGEKALALFIEFVERGLPADNLSVEVEILKLKKEGDDLETKAMSGAPLDSLKDEVVDIQIQAGQTLRAILRKSINAIAARNGK